MKEDETMNKLRMLSVSVVLAMLFTFANEEARAQTDAQVLNKVAADIRNSLPETIGDVEFTDAISYCSAGCQGNNATSFLGITGRTPRLVRQNVSIGQLELSVKPQMLRDYCTSEAKQRNIGSTVTIYDMYNALIGSFFVTPADCPANLTPNVAPNTSQSTPTRTSPDAQFLTTLAADTRKTLPTTIGDVEFTDATTYCPAGCQRNYATSLLGLTGWTPRLVKQNVSIGQLERSVKPQMLKDYCTSPAKQRNIGGAVYVYDMYKAYIGVFSIGPGDCAAVSVTPNVTPNTSAASSVEDQYWDAVKNSSRVGDFQAYLNYYPYGQYASIARLRINQLGGSASSASSPTQVSPGNYNPLPSGSAASTVEQQYWDAVKNSTRASDFQDYLNNYPNGQYAPIARLRISQLGGSVSSGSAPTSGVSNPSSMPSATSSVEQQYWDAVKNSSRVEDFQNYLRDYPNGQFVPIARLKISQLSGNAPTNPAVNSTAEDQYWNNISNSQRAQDFQGYLYNYPNGMYSSLARLRISQLGSSTTQSSPVVSAVEEQYWNNVRYSQRAQDFQDYLNNYPNGQYSLIARVRINQLTAGPAPNTIPGAAPPQQTVAQVLASAQYGSINEILPLRKVFVVATDLDSRDTILRELQPISKLMVVGRKEDAEFFVIFALTDQATGANVVGNTNPSNATYLGEMLVCSTGTGPNGAPVPRILWRTKKTQVFTNGLTFNRPPPVNATRDFVKELRKLNY